MPPFFFKSNSNGYFLFFDCRFKIKTKSKKLFLCHFIFLPSLTTLKLKVYAVIPVKGRQIIQLFHLAFREELLRLWPGSMNVIEGIFINQNTTGGK